MLENLDDHGCLKIRDRVDPSSDEEIWFRLSYPFRHMTTLHCAEQKAKLLGNWIMQRLNVKILSCEPECQFSRN